MRIHRSKLLQIPKSELIDPHPEIPAKKSGVIIPLYEKDGKEGVILTKRNSNLRNHPGQISFPGGVHGQEDMSLKETAFREWEEEVGVSREALQFIAPYRPFHTFTGYIIYPFFAQYSGNFQFNINKSEVEELIFLDFESFETLPFYSGVHPRKPDYPIYYLDLGKELLWGATGFILVSFLRELAEFQRTPRSVLLNLLHPPFFDPKVI